jgi:hypothetical protein
MRRTQTLDLVYFDVPMSAAKEVNTSVCWVTEFKVLGTPMSRWNLPSVLEYIPLSRLAVWLRESDQLLERVEANQKL